jgi:hypothetical protein
MTRLAIFALLGLLAIPFAQSADAQQAPGNPGFSRLLCMGESSIGISPVTVPNEQNGWIGEAEVFLPHGNSGGGSTHRVVYEDTNRSGELNCGDAVLSVR